MKLKAFTVQIVNAIVVIAVLSFNGALVSIFLYNMSDFCCDS